VLKREPRRLAGTNAATADLRMAGSTMIATRSPMQ